VESWLFTSYTDYAKTHFFSTSVPPRLGVFLLNPSISLLKSAPVALYSTELLELGFKQGLSLQNLPGV
jgi:hypothetical protein